MNYYLKNAFDYEIRNNIDLRINEFNDLDELSELETDELKILEGVREYLLKRVGELKTWHTIFRCYSIITGAQYDREKAMDYGRQVYLPLA